MVFSSLLFLFVYLPIVLACYYLCPKAWRNGLLLGASLLFYSWGEGIYMLLMIGSVMINWFFGNLIGQDQRRDGRKKLLIMVVLINLSPLLWFKYSSFFLVNLSTVFPVVENAIEQHQLDLHLPIGISFFTFQALSYVIDVYRGTVCHQKNIVNLGLYIAFFPQLIAGPIVRYHDIASQIIKRRVTAPFFAEGVSRFIIGLAKKVLLANQLGVVADTVFALPVESLSTSVAWIGIACFTLQIYYDFSGYSDMAIGLGRMFGFSFLENFNYPYSALSMRDFWRRWHISLSNWFRDYLYLPMGGNRQGSGRTTLNLLTVFILCGLWHGASWNFLLWGLAHGFLLLIERGRFGGIIKHLPIPLRHFYVLFFVIHTWVLFRVESVEGITQFYAALYGQSASTASFLPVLHLMDLDCILALVFGLTAMTPFWRQGWYTLQKLLLRVSGEYGGGLAASLHYLLLCGLFFVSWLQLAGGAYNPFIYFRF